MNKPNVGLKNAIKKCNPMAGFVHIWPKVGLKQHSNFQSVLKTPHTLLEEMVLFRTRNGPPLHIWNSKMVLYRTIFFCKRFYI